MKRYIKSSGRTDKNLKYQSAIRQDLKTLARADSFEDIENSEFHSINIKHVLDAFRRHDPQNSDDFEAFYDYAYDWLLQQRDWIKKEVDDSSNAEVEAHKVLTLIKTSFDDIITDIEEDDDRIYISISDPSLQEHDDYIRLADEVRDAIGGRYYGTGRGGSWTAWNLLSDTGVELQVGSPDSMIARHLSPGSNAFIMIYQ